MHAWVGRVVEDGQWVAAFRHLHPKYLTSMPEHLIDTVDQKLQSYPFMSRVLVHTNQLALGSEEDEFVVDLAQ